MNTETDVIGPAILYLNGRAEDILIKAETSTLTKDQQKKLRAKARRFISAASCLASVEPGTKLANVEYLWRIPSERNPAQFYLAGPNTCNCDAGLNHLRCKHMNASIALSIVVGNPPPFKDEDDDKDLALGDSQEEDSRWKVGVVHP